MPNSYSYSMRARALLTRIAGRMDMIDPNAPILSEINDFLDERIPPSGPNWQECVRCGAAILNEHPEQSATRSSGS